MCLGKRRKWNNSTAVNHGGNMVSIVQSNPVYDYMNYVIFDISDAALHHSL